MSFFMKLFLWARRGKEIPMTIQDGKYGIFLPSVANLINRDLAKDLGGFNDIFFPAADSVFWEKCIKYYGAAFVPSQLYCYRVSKNESLNEETAKSSFHAVGSLVKAIRESQGETEDQSKYGYIEGYIMAFNVSLFHLYSKKKLCMKDAASHLQIPKKYNSQLIQSLIMLKYYLRWGLLLFRTRKHVE